MSQLKIALFTPTLGRGGAEMQLLRLANAWAERGREVIVVCIRAGGEYEKMLDPRCRLVHLTGSIKSATLAGLICRPRFIRFLEEHRPAVVLAVLNQTSAIIADVIDSLRVRPALILGVQNNITELLRNLPAWRRSLTRRQLRAAFPRAEHIVALSKGAESALNLEFPETAGKTVVIYNAGFDATVSQNAAAELPLAIPENLIVACGRLHPQKDYGCLLRAFALLRARVPATLWILGEGPDRRKLEELSISLEVATSVRFWGFLPNPHAVIARAKVFALSSRWEGFANVIVEAMCCGVPVVATDCPSGPGEIIVSGESGLLVPIGDPMSLAVAIERILLSPEVAQRFIQNGRARISRFSVENSAQSYDRLLTQIVDSSK